VDSISHIRKEYQLHSLNERDMEDNALKQFEKWWKEALNSELDEVNAMSLATVNKEGKPSVRTVLLKGFEENGFVFYTNYQSKKGVDLESNPNTSLLFFWKELQRQVRIDGIAEKISEAESSAYFITRPRGSQLSTCASGQSSIIPNREMLEKNVGELEKKYAGLEIPKPAHWGGYIVIPFEIEFWQGRPNRLHDRIKYIRQPNNEWKLVRLAP